MRRLFPLLLFLCGSLLVTSVILQSSAKNILLHIFNPQPAYAATYTISGRIACQGCGSEPYGGYPNIPYNISGPSSAFGATGFNGTFTAGNLKAGTYLVSIAPGACLSGVTQQSATLGPNKSVSFSVIPKTNT